MRGGLHGSATSSAALPVEAAPYAGVRQAPPRGVRGGVGGHVLWDKLFLAVRVVFGADRARGSTTPGSARARPGPSAYPA